MKGALILMGREVEWKEPFVQGTMYLATQTTATDLRVYLTTAAFEAWILPSRAVDRGKRTILNVPVAPERLSPGPGASLSPWGLITGQIEPPSPTRTAYQHIDV